MYSSTILLVQPQNDLGALLRLRLEGKGYTVVEAPDAKTAMIGKSKCLARTIGKSPALRRTKLLAYTTHGKKRDRSWAQRIGADGYVITRSGEDRFLSVVNHLMEAPSTPRRTSRRPRPS